MEISESMMTEDYSYFLTNDTHKYLTTSSNDSLLHSTNVTTPPVPQSRDEELAKIEIAILALIFSFTVLGNFIVILGIYFRRQKMSRMYYFILHLSIADLITAFFNVLTQLIWELTWHFQGGNILCKFIKYAQIFGPYSSSYVLIMTAIDRYQAICFPLSNCTWTARRSKLMLAFAWTLSILLCVPQLFIFSYMEVSPGVEDCWATFVEGWGAQAYVTWYAITVFIIPLIILTFSYSCICRAIWINFSMKNSIRRHQFSRSSRISRDSETENEFCHSIADNNSLETHPQIGGLISSRGLSIPRRSINKSSFNNSRKPSSDTSLLPKTLEVSWNRNSETEGGGGGHRTGGVKPNSNPNPTMTLTTSFTKDPEDLQDSHHNSNSGQQNEQMLDLIRYHPHPTTNLRRARYSSSPPDPGETDDDSEMDETTICSSNSPLPQFSMDKVQMYPNGSGGGGKYSIPIHPDENLISHSREGGGGDGDLKYKLNRNGSNSPNSLTTNSTPVKTRTYVWFSSKNSNSNTKQNDQGSHSSELKSKRKTLTQFLLPQTKKSHSHSSVSKQSDSVGLVGGGGAGVEERFRNRTISSASFRQPRSSSVKGISRAKIKTVKLTVTVICCYVFCSSPFIAAQLWATYDPDAIKSPFWTGATFTILTLLASLNSCVNPWIFLFFNPNLLQDFLKGFGCSRFLRTHQKTIGSHSPHSATQVTNASPGLISRASRRDTKTTHRGSESRNPENLAISSTGVPHPHMNLTPSPMGGVSTCLKISPQGTPRPSHNLTPSSIPPGRNWESA